MSQNNSKKTIALIGNPNSGKTALFNILTGLNQKVSNYPGITVEKKTGIAKINSSLNIELIDLPGTYSIIPNSMDESLVTTQILDWMLGGTKPDLILSVVDSTNLSRNLFLTSQLLDLEIPIIIVLNMMDLVKKEESINPKFIKNQFGVSDAVSISALKNSGLDELKKSIENSIKNPEINQSSFLDTSIPFKEEFIKIEKLLENCNYQSEKFTKAQVLRCVSTTRMIEYLDIDSNIKVGITKIRELIVKSAMKSGKLQQIMEPALRYNWIENKLENKPINENVNSISQSEKVDKFLTHPAFGMIFFVSLLYFIFKSIFSWSSAPMDFIDSQVVAFGQFVSGIISPGLLHDLIVEGVIAGVGGIIIFLPQILILIFFLTLLEDTGYMARVAFMMDRIMSIAGLHGKSILPLMSGYACAIPGIMASRTIESSKQRLVTMMVLPLLSCSARLPVYSLLIGAFVPSVSIWGFDAQGLTLVFMYFLGTITAFLLAILFSKFISEKNENSSFIMELPPYRMPLWRSVFRQVYMKGKGFVKDAGKIIMAISILLWFMASFPKLENGDSVSIDQSYAGKVGHFIEPLIEPLGYDWKIGIGLITSFAAREVLVSTLATIYNVEAEDDNIIPLKIAMKNEKDENGNPKYTILVALSLMVFYVFAAQCMATFAIIKKETNSWKWPVFMIVYMSILAYGGAFIVYQGGLALGFS
jgi:ferrous iron transport protein B